MKSILLLSLLLIFNFTAIGGKTYSLTIRVQGRSKNISVAGVKVFIIIVTSKKQKPLPTNTFPDFFGI